MGGWPELPAPQARPLSHVGAGVSPRPVRGSLGALLLGPLPRSTKRPWKGPCALRTRDWSCCLVTPSHQNPRWPKGRTSNRAGAPPPPQALSTPERARGPARALGRGHPLEPSIIPLDAASVCPLGLPGHALGGEVTAPVTQCPGAPGLDPSQDSAGQTIRDAETEAWGGLRDSPPGPWQHPHPVQVRAGRGLRGSRAQGQAVFPCSHRNHTPASCTRAPWGHRGQRTGLACPRSQTCLGLGEGEGPSLPLGPPARSPQSGQQPQAPQHSPAPRSGNNPVSPKQAGPWGAAGRVHTWTGPSCMFSPESSLSWNDLDSGSWLSMRGGPCWAPRLPSKSWSEPSGREGSSWPSLPAVGSWSGSPRPELLGRAGTGPGHGGQVVSVCVLRKGVRWLLPCDPAVAGHFGAQWALLSRAPAAWLGSDKQETPRPPRPGEKL